MQMDWNNLKDLAKGKESENWEFRKFLKFYDDLSDEELDQLVFKTADKLCSMIECTSCGRCCRELHPTLSDGDQQRLANRLEMTVEELRGKYLEFDHEDDVAWRIIGAPCCFYKDNKCTVYDDRPQNCRDYPYLHEPQFSYRTIGMIERTFTCPIVFCLMERLKDELAFQEDELDEDWI